MQISNTVTDLGFVPNSKKNYLLANNNNKFMPSPQIDAAEYKAKISGLTNQPSGLHTLQEVESDEATKKAAQEYESMFIGEMLRPMFESQEVNEVFGGGQSEKIYRSMLVEEYGKQISKAGGMGIAKNIEAELNRLKHKD